ncbi:MULTISPECIES: DUF4062 domain-containing protein [Empedobacter]|uniref:DUF4062 domain-containing protein n=1 Tax=Empedobacter falsenii TaxID=343874 RepID=A0A7H9DRH5_9FLAO|nr:MULTISPECIES: DUF4062 domain-containing protein [Empedobacter]MDH2208412.1 DUF4062 domain-containing protein [Empedobacter sp. GD03644]QLL57782.1 DUF4062 domain-containing protein [Empedobacter falsenii]
MDKKYQVFVSSTYIDLLEERQEIMQALLELDCIPAGMELFPASNDDQWSLIKGVIDDCDYYIVVIAGRYGSLSESGLSYTEMEYRYALETGKPVIAFLHKDPDALPKKNTEKTEEGQNKLNEFRGLAQKKMCKYWSTPQELGSVVSRSLISLQKKYPGIGWIRGNVKTSTEANLEILKLKNQIEDLENKLIESRTKAPEGTSELSQGNDKFSIELLIRFGSSRYDSKFYTETLETTWNQIFYWLSPSMIDDASTNTLKLTISKYAFVELKKRFVKKSGLPSGGKFYDYEINDADFQTIIVQLRALGLLNKSSKTRSIKDSGTYWSLTNYGDEVMTRLRAIKK